MKIEKIDLEKLRTNANQLKHYNRQIKNHDFCLILYDYTSKEEFYLTEEDIFNYNGNNKKDRYKKDTYDFKNYLDDDFKPYAFDGYFFIYSKYFKTKTPKQKLQNYQIEIIKTMKRTFKSNEERDFFIKYVEYLEEKKEDLFEEYLKYFNKLRDSRTRFNNILKAINNKTIFFNLNKRDKKKYTQITKKNAKILKNINSDGNHLF